MFTNTNASRLTADVFMAAYRRLIPEKPKGPRNIVYTETAKTQFRKPRSKRKRIRRKWEKMSRNWRPMKGGLVVGDTLYIHPAHRNELERLDRSAVQVRS